jgi:hypothetical protein
MKTVVKLEGKEVVVEVKGLKVIESMSEETTCFSAIVNLNGKKAFAISNRGCGGCDDIELISINGTEYEKLNQAFIDTFGKSKTPILTDMDDWSYDNDIETFLAKCVDLYYMKKDITKMWKKLTVMEKNADSYSQYNGEVNERNINYISTQLKEGEKLLQASFDTKEEAMKNWVFEKQYNNLVFFDTDKRVSLKPKNVVSKPTYGVFESVIQEVK